MKRISILLFIFLFSLLVACSSNEDEQNPIIDEVYFEVSFITNSDEKMESKMVLQGLTIEEPIITKEGYNFLGWYLDDVEFDFNEKIYKDITLIAKWEEIKKIEYLLEFNIKSVQLEVGNTYKFSFRTKNIENLDDIKISVEDNSIASIDGYIVKGIGVGKTNIIATYNDKKATLIVIVKEKELKIIDVDYWINLNNNPEEVVMDAKEIESFNNQVYSDYSKTKVYNLNNLSINVSCSYIKGLIENYTTMSKYNVYNNGSLVSTSEKETILNNRNLSSISENATYGVVVNFCSVRSYPTMYYANNKEYDKFQETGLSAGEGVIVYHYSLDNNWCFIQSSNYNGWVEAKNISECSKEDFQKFYNPNNFVIVLSERETYNNLVYRLGDKIPYISKSDYTYKILIPTRLSDKSLEISEVEVSNQNLNDGYLLYTYRNLYNEAFKLLNTPYCWGDYDVKGRDCSSTLNSIYKCFGFDMPRNTSNQRKISGYSETVNGLNASTLSKYQVGTMIFTSSHVMLYIGCDKNGNPYLLHNSGGCKIQLATSYGLDKIIGVLKVY